MNLFWIRSEEGNIINEKTVEIRLKSSGNTLEKWGKWGWDWVLGYGAGGRLECEDELYTGKTLENANEIRLKRLRNTLEKIRKYT